jgi:hypothetical protein
MAECSILQVLLLSGSCRSASEGGKGMKGIKERKKERG